MQLLSNSHGELLASSRPLPTLAYATQAPTGSSSQENRPGGVSMHIGVRDLFLDTHFSESKASLVTGQTMTYQDGSPVATMIRHKFSNEPHCVLRAMWYPENQSSYVVTIFSMP